MVKVRERCLRRWIQNGLGMQRENKRNTATPTVITVGRRKDLAIEVSKEREAKEEGEIRDAKKSQNARLSHTFLAEIFGTQEEVPKILSIPLGENHEVVLTLIGTEDGTMVGEGNDLVVEETKTDNIDHAIKDSIEDDFQSLTDGEIEDDVRMLDAMTEVPEREKVIEGVEGKDQVAGEAAKRQGACRKALKPPQGTGTSNKLKMSEMMNSKRPVAKPGIRHGDHSKQVEEKGTSNPKQDPAKY
ncbi:hypothetical protein Bca52824_017611 [Brassica carinata]|uniref:Uncharacterized protein n=1 Tax=Brassica carinata TaxID=52824 RepID=A0A8X7VMW9_BRACI|nr:hypothetical protein Bca52824_017611 [Brassica carinata]